VTPNARRAQLPAPSLTARYQGKARLQGGGRQSPQTLANRQARQAHSDYLRHASQSLSDNWRERKAQRQAQNLPIIPQGIPILLQVDPSLDLDALREKFAFEIVAEQEEGYVIISTYLFMRRRLGYEVPNTNQRRSNEAQQRGRGCCNHKAVPTILRFLLLWL
jgi:hypothetical protein